MFYNCEQLLYLHNFNEINTNKVIDMSYMFYNCISILENSINILKWDLSNVTNIDKIFYNIRSQINIIYKINKEQPKIKLFGEEFVKKNKDNCFIFINNKKYELIEFLNLKNYGDKDKLKIILTETSTITNMSHMFENCKDLISLPDISDWDTSNVTDINNIFSNCELLSDFGGISKWNTKMIIDISYSFFNLKIKSKFPDISNWDLSNLKDASHLFDTCELLECLPDISKWNVSNVNNLSGIFANCNSLKELPDISKWNIINTNNISYMFYNCQKIEKIPDISSWNTQNVTNASYMFFGCFSLKQLPDISKWNALNFTNISFIFSDCTSLLNIPNISNWNTINVKNMNYLFSNCFSLDIIPDITKWNTKNVEEMNNMFYHIRNEMTIIYKIKKELPKIKLFGKNFVENNKNNFYIRIINKFYNLIEYYELDENMNNNNNELLTIQLIQIHRINNLSYMFDNCDNKRCCRWLICLIIVNH